MRMTQTTIATVGAHVEAIRLEIEQMKSVMEMEKLAASDRNYLQRCFELLRIEVSAIDDYVRSLG
jgi:hypothetical protein